MGSLFLCKGGDVMYEVWVQIPGHPDYEISNVGEIRHSGPDILVKPTVNRGYLRVRINGERYYIHQLMMLSFYPDVCSSRYIKHIDGDKSNNRLSNLRYAGPF